MNGILVQGPKAILANSSGTKSELIPKTYYLRPIID